MSYRAFEIGQICRIARGHHSSTIGMFVIVTSHPYSLGVITDERSTFCGMPPDTVIQDIQMYDREANAIVKDYERECGMRLASPPEFLDPVRDGDGPIEWTDELRELCGLKKKGKVAASED